MMTITRRHVYSQLSHVGTRQRQHVVISACRRRKGNERVPLRRVTRVVGKDRIDRMTNEDDDD